MTEQIPFLDPDDDDEDDDEIEADVNPIAVCRYCGSPDCTGTCFVNLGYNTP